MSETNLNGKHFFIPPRELQLSEGDEAPDKIQLFRVGTFHHDEYGPLKITPAVLEEMVENFKNDVRGIDLAVDYKHESEDKAAAWIKDVFLNDEKTGMFARVQWTPAGRQVVEDKEFRYISPDFGFKSQDKETLKWFGPTLNGAALTNRPFIKRMNPVVQLSEGAATFDEDDEQENDDMKIEEAQAKIKELEKQTKKLSEENTALSDKVKAAEADKKVCDEANMTPEEMMAKIAELTKQLEDMKKKANDATIQASEAKKTAEFNVLLTDGKAVEAQRDAFMKGDTAAFAQLSEKVNLGARGTGKEPPPAKEVNTQADAEKEIERLAHVALTEKKATTYGEAVRFVLAEKKDLAAKYRGEGVAA